MSFLFGLTCAAVTAPFAETSLQPMDRYKGCSAHHRVVLVTKNDEASSFDLKDHSSSSDDAFTFDAVIMTAGSDGSAEEDKATEHPVVTTQGAVASAETELQAVSQGSSANDLAQQLANPVASLIQVPVQSNIDFGIGPNDGFRITTNVQPVIPVGINEDWNVISRTIVPIIYQDDITGPRSSQFGLGDVLQSVFFSPKAVGDNGVIWGAGPAVLLRTGTESGLSAEKWGIGPTGVLLKQDGPWTYGILANQIWSFAGNDQRSDISQAFIQPFLTYINQDQVTFAANSETTYNWIDDQATIPINFNISKLYPGKQPFQLGFGARYYVERPENGPEWGLRIQFTLLFPAG